MGATQLKKLRVCKHILIQTSLLVVVWEVTPEVCPSIVDTLSTVHAQCNTSIQGGNKQCLCIVCMKTEVVFRMWCWSHHGRSKRYISYDACVYLSRSGQ